VPVGIEIEVELAAAWLVDDDAAAAVDTDAAESPVYS
jgi:hypothetical protein